MAEYQYKQADDDDEEGSPRENLIKEYDLDDNQADIIMDLLDQIDAEVDDVDRLKEGEGYNGAATQVNAGGQEYLVYDNEEDPFDDAVSYVLSLVEEVGLGEVKYWDQFVDEDRTENFFRQVYSEWLTEDVYEMNEDDLAEALEKWGADDEDELAEMMVDSRIDEGEGGLTHWRDNFGEEETTKLLIDNDLIDIDAYAKWAVKTDGVAHFLASYDGNMLDLAHGAEAYRIG